MSLRSKLLPFDVKDELPDVPYQVKDDSLLYPTIKKYLWLPLLRLVPEEFAANTMTLVSNAGSLLAFFTAIILASVESFNPILLLVPGFGLFFYLSLDNMDGAQARRTNTSSQLGEFLDHWFDSINIGLITLAIFMTLQIPNWLALVLVAIASINFFSQVWEQRITGWLILPKLGSVEGIMIVVVLYVIMAITGLGWFTTPLFFGWVSFGVLLTLAVATGYLVMPLGSMWRLKGHYGYFLPIVVSMGACLVWYMIAPLPFLMVGMLLVLLSGIMCGRMVIARVTNSRYKGYDRILIAALIMPIVGTMFFNWSVGLQIAWAIGLITYMSLRLVADFSFTVLRMQCFLKEREFLSLAIGFPKRLRFRP